MIPTVLDLSAVGAVPPLPQVQPWSAMDQAVSDDVLDQLEDLGSLGKSDLYDLAEQMLSELIPGWEDEDEDVADMEVEDSEVVSDVRVTSTETWCRDREADVAPVPVDECHVVDASYLECMREAERYLVQCEGFAKDDDVVVALRRHLDSARTQAVHREGVRVLRTPGCP